MVKAIVDEATNRPSNEFLRGTANNCLPFKQKKRRPYEMVSGLNNQTKKWEFVVEFQMS